MINLPNWLIPYWGRTVPLLPRYTWRSCWSLHNLHPEKLIFFFNIMLFLKTLTWLFQKRRQQGRRWGALHRESWSAIWRAGEMERWRDFKIETITSLVVEMMSLTAALTFYLVRPMVRLLMMVEMSTSGQSLYSTDPTESSLYSPAPHEQFQHLQCLQPISSSWPFHLEINVCACLISALTYFERYLKSTFS